MSSSKKIWKTTRVGISWGDPHGIGSECILKAFAEPSVAEQMTPIVYGDSAELKRQAAFFGLEDIQINQTHALQCVDVVQIPPPRWGEPSAEAGTVARKSLERATEDLLAGKIDVLVTAPINKDVIQGEGFNFPGHTEYLAKMAGAQEVLMLLVSGDLRVGIVTGHVPIQEVAGGVTAEAIRSKYDILHRTLVQDYRIESPRIAVLGLNPHAGDNGLIGSEEQTIIGPVIREYQTGGHRVEGPFGADGFFGNSTYKAFDGVLAMYHDQGLGPFKSLAFGSGVNFTAGLPFVRTSPDHGTAFNIAGQNQASGDALRGACFAALRIHANRLKNKEMARSPQAQ
jgi:4-hydroxythreonine-4-phosphate dehydrogenase